MKIIDEKGRLFGKINVIYFLVILFLISLTPMFYYGYKIFNAPPPPPPLQEWATVKVKFNGLIPEIVSLINKGDYEGIIKENDAKDIKQDIDEGNYCYN